MFAEIPVLFVFVLPPFCEKVVDFLRKVGENERKVVRFFEATDCFLHRMVYVERKGGDVCRFCVLIEEAFRCCGCAVGTLGFEKAVFCKIGRHFCRERPEKYMKKHAVARQ